MFQPIEGRMLAVDSDMVLFRMAAKTEVEVELSDWVWVRHSDCQKAMELYWQQIYEWGEESARQLKIRDERDVDRLIHRFRQEQAER